jgi:hypothetical protein
MNLFRIDMKLCATAYIKAENAADALKIAKAMHMLSPSILDHYADIPVTGLDFNNPDLPAVSFSPAMTIYEPEGAPAEAEDFDTEVPYSEEDKQQVEQLLAIGAGYSVCRDGNGKWLWQDKRGGEADVRFDTEELAWSDAYAAMKRAEG